MKYLALAFLLLASLALADGLAALTAADSPLRAGDRILFVGDSITAAADGPTGFVTLVRKALDEQRPELKATVLGAGVPGLRATAYVGWRTAVVLRPHQPSVVFYYIGVNDVWHREKRFGGDGTRPEDYEAALRKVIGALQTAGATVVLATPATIGEKTDGTNDMRHAMPSFPPKDDAPVPADVPLEQYCAISRKVAAEMGIELCDLRKIFLDELKTRNPENKESGILTIDGVHLNAAGNALVAREAASSIVRALQRPAARLFVPAGDPAYANAITHADNELYLDERRECRLAPATVPIFARVPLEMHYTLDGTEPTAASPRYQTPLVLAAKDGKPTEYPLKALGIDAAGAASKLAMTIAVLPPLPSAAGVPEQLVPGLRYEAFSPDAKDPAVSKLVADLALKPETRQAGARYRFSGWLDIPADGLYLVRTQARDRFTVTFDNAWSHTQNGPGWTSEAVGLAAGRHRFVLEYTDSGNPGYFLNFLMVQGHIEQGKRMPLTFWTEKE